MPRYSENEPYPSAEKQQPPEGHMQQHLCACVVDIMNEHLTTIEFDVDNLPKPWPEVRILQEIHGEEAVYNIRPVALAPRESPLREKERLVLKYGRDVVEAVYAGKSFTMEFFVPGWPIDPEKAKKRKAPNDRPKPARFVPAPGTETTEVSSADMRV